MSSALKTGFAILAENADDIEAIVKKIGIANLIALAPAILRIVKTVADNKDPNEAMGEVEARLYYGAETKKSVHDFQRLHGLTADGIVGKETWAKVQEIIKASS